MKKIVYSALVVLSIVGMTSCSRDFTETQFFQEEQAGRTVRVLCKRYLFENESN